jgi:hypothetical protein
MFVEIIRQSFAKRLQELEEQESGEAEKAPLHNQQFPLFL